MAAKNKKKLGAKKTVEKTAPDEGFGLRYVGGIIILIALIIIGYFLVTTLTTEPGCHDNDNRNYFSNGKVNLNGEASADICLDAAHVKEYFCDNNTTKEEMVYCEYGCVEGSCRKKTNYCGGKYNVSCPTGLTCDYSDATYITEIGVCKERATVREPTSKENYLYICYTPDSSIGSVNLFLKNQLMYYITNAYFGKVLVPIGTYINPPKNTTWQLRLVEDIHDSEFMKRLFSIRNGQNALGNITCEAIGNTPPYFQEFIDNHPFLYKRKLIAAIPFQKNVETN